MRDAISRRHALGAMLGGAAGLAVAVSGCSSGPKSAAASSTGAATFWTLQDPTNTVQQAAVNAFNSGGDGKVTMDVIATSGYLDKLRTAMGSSEMPGVFFSWGGGNLDYYAQAGKLVDLDPSLESHFLSSALQAGIYNGKLIGVPCRGTQPVFIFYNKQAFAAAGVQPPTTWSELTSLVTTFKSKNITPFALAGTSTSSWTELMWMEYLVDRLAGPGLFQKLQGGDWSQWSDPAMLKAAQMVTELVGSGAFGRNFASVNYGAGGTSTLLATGKAAMCLMGSWEYATQQGISASFAKNDLGYVPFPAVEGGKGDPANVVGNPTNYLSVTTAAPRQTAADFLATTYSDSYIKGLVGKGEIPVTTNGRQMLSAAADPAYATFQYDLVSKAPSFTQSWDQALGSTLATPMLTEMQKLFNGQDTSKQFVSNVLAIKS
jgi:xylobiose transport system substrate-binding protein